MRTGYITETAEEILRNIETIYNIGKSGFQTARNYLNGHPKLKRGLIGTGVTLGVAGLTALITPNSGLEKEILEPLGKTVVAVTANKSLKDAIGRENISEGWNTGIDLATYALITGAYLRGLISGADNLLERIPYGEYLSYPFEQAKQFLNKNIGTKLIAALGMVPTYPYAKKIGRGIKNIFS